MKKRTMAILVCMVIMIGGTACSSQKEDPVESSAYHAEASTDSEISVEGKEETSIQEMSIEETGIEETSIEETGVEKTSIVGTSVKETGVKESGTEESADSLIENADLNGHIVNFSDSEISMSVAKLETDENGGEIMVAAAPGAEEENDLVHITYAENAVIQILTIDRKSQKKLSLKEVDKSSIKEQDSVLIYGSCQNTYQWTAEKIIIVKFV